MLGREVVVKERLVKTYRHSDLDEQLTRARITHEARCLHRCLVAGIDVPSVLMVDLPRRLLLLEAVPGESVKDLLRREAASPAGITPMPWLTQGIGAAVAAMHGLGIVHGDLTTSNLLLRRPKEADAAPSVVILDFGLGHQGTLEEDYAVDLYVLERALIATHPNTQQLVRSIHAAHAIPDNCVV